MKLEAESLREFVELARGSRIEIRPKVLCVNLNSDSNVPLVMQLQFVIEFSSDLLGKKLRHVEVIADGVSVATDTVCYTSEKKIEIGVLMNDLKNKAALRFEELTKLFEERQIEVVLYNLDGTIRR